MRHLPAFRPLCCLLMLSAPIGAGASPLTPSGASGVADERCVNAAGVVVRERVVPWRVDWRYIDRVLWFGSSSWYGDSPDYVYDFEYTGIDVTWRFGGGSTLIATDGVVVSHVSTLAVSPGDSWSLQHHGELVGAGALTGGLSAAGTDWSGTGFSDGAITTFDPDTLTSATLSLGFATPSVTCTWEGSVNRWVPSEDCANGADEDGDGLVDGDDPQCQACGDGVLDAHEACDDGGLVPGDLCDASCRIEPDSDGDGVPDFDDRCDGEDDSVDSDSDMRPDCLPPIGGGEAAGTADLSCVDRVTGVERADTVDWVVTWDIATAYDFFYFDHSSDDTTYEWMQMWGVDSEWTLDGVTVSFTDGEMYGADYDGPDGDYDYFFLANYQTEGDVTRIVDIQVTEGDFLVGDVSAGDVRVDLTRAPYALFSWYEETPDEICRIYGTFDSFGDQGPDGDGVPEGWDLCPSEDASGWDLDLDGCLDDTDSDGVTDDVDVCPLGDDAADPDGDGVASACDACPAHPDDDVDGDGLCADVDACPYDAAGSDDDDRDGVCNTDDLCHVGGDGWVGGSEDDLRDDDLDGVADGCDPCVAFDADGDGVADGCSVDGDGDGVWDTDDACPATEPGEPVLTTGCSVAQACPDARPWPSHEVYVGCVWTVADRLFADGTITRAEMNTIKREASLSGIGS
jgi:cysteine-rich repeat protein